MENTSDITRELRSRLSHLGLTEAQAAERAGVSLEEAAKVFEGDPGATLGALGALSETLGCVAVVVPRPLAPAVLAGSEPTEPQVETVVSAALRQLRMPATLRVGGQERADVRSLALHEAAVQVLREQPERAQRALEVLDRWTATNDASTQPLASRWRAVIQAQDWAAVLDNSEEGRQLRRASPLGAVLDEETRRSVLGAQGGGRTRMPFGGGF